LEEKMSLKCTVSIQQEENWYVATCLENNIASQGKTMDEAMTNLKEAIALFYEDYEDEDRFPEYPQVYITTLEVAV
jgi:predicted RNase H-like HicB family nuclease